MTVRIILYSTQRQTAACLLFVRDHPFYNFVLSFHQILFLPKGNLAELSLFHRFIYFARYFWSSMMNKKDKRGYKVNEAINN